MTIEFTKHGWDDFQYWVTDNPKTVKKIVELLKSIQSNPFIGIGKPEPLKHQLKGKWSRRISDEHRLVYKIVGRNIENRKCVIFQCRFHYGK